MYHIGWLFNTKTLSNPRTRLTIKLTTVAPFTVSLYFGNGWLDYKYYAKYVSRILKRKRCQTISVFLQCDTLGHTYTHTCGEYKWKHKRKHTHIHTCAKNWTENTRERFQSQISRWYALRLWIFARAYRKLLILLISSIHIFFFKNEFFMNHFHGYRKIARSSEFKTKN